MKTAHPLPPRRHCLLLGLLPGLLLALAAGLLPALAAQPAQAAEDWFLLEFSASKPPCSTAAVDEGRCWGTRADVTRFEMRGNERIDLPTGSELPPAWATFNELWVYAPAAAGNTLRRSITLTPTPMGVRLIINDEGRDYVQSLVLNEWVQLRGGLHRNLWVRVTRE